MVPALKHIVVPAVTQHTATIFFLHGLGDSGHGWAPVAKMLSPLLPHAKWILPHAPTRPITLNNGFPMPAWYDIHSLNAGGPEDLPAILESVAGIHDLIKAEVASGIPADRIIVGGFSQGGAVALSLNLMSNDYKFAGFVVLSGYLPLSQSIPSVIKDTNKDTRIAMFHGEADEVVAYRWGQMSKDKMEQLGRGPISFKSYPGMGHSTCPEELKDVATALNDMLK
ncbi:acyl-protein thioesterase-1 [Phlyctochytrium arcticum]|nr:acyl-protein thioesterase-1 [Phlyctochytrium arcticum]